MEGIVLTPSNGGSQPFSVKTYGAKGDGVTDDTAAIQATVNVCEAAGGGVVFFPVGVYIVSAEITIVGAAAGIAPPGETGGVTIAGASKRGSRVHATAGFTLFNVSNGAVGNNVKGLRDIWLDGPGKAVANGLAFFSDTGGGYSYQSVFVTNFETGFSFYDSTRGNATDVVVWACGTGVKFGWQSDEHIWDSCSVHNCDVGYKMGQTDGTHTTRVLSANCMVFLGGEIHHCGLGFQLYDASATGVKFLGVYFEANVKDGEVSDSGTPSAYDNVGISFDSCWWDPILANTGGIAIEVFDSAQLEFRNCAAAVYPVFLKFRKDIFASGARLIWEHNEIAGSTGTIMFDTRYYNPGKDSLRFNETITHVVPADQGNLPSSTPAHEMQLTAGTGKVFHQWTRRNSNDNSVANSARIQDVGGVLHIEGVTESFITATNVSALPSASVNYRGCFAFIPGAAGVADKVYVCIKNTAGGYVWMLFTTATGIGAKSLSPSLNQLPYDKTWVEYLPNASTAIRSNGTGTVPSTSGTVSTITSTAASGPMINLVSSGAGAAIADMNAGAPFAILRGTAGDVFGGWFAHCRAMYPDASYDATGASTGSRIWPLAFYGTSQTTLFGADRGGTQNISGFVRAHVNGGVSDTNFQFVTCNNSSTTTADTGMPFTASHVYDFFQWCPVGSTTIYWQVDDLTAGTTASGSATGTLPITTNPLVVASGCSSVDAVARNARIGRLYVEADNG